MNTFKVGQLVECISDSGQRHWIKRGNIYKISELDTAMDKVKLENVSGWKKKHRFVPASPKLERKLLLCSNSI